MRHRSSQFGSQFEEESVKAREIGAKKIEGARFARNGVCEINNDQAELDEKMKELEKKFEDATNEWQTERKVEDKKIFQRQLKDEDINEYKR